MPDTIDMQTGEVLAVSDYQTSHAVNEIFAALAKAQGEIRTAGKAAKGNFGKYADLDAIVEASREPLSKNGIAVVQIPHNDGENIAVTTVLGHASGQWISGKIKVKPAKWDAQGAGSVITYLRRYSLAAMAGVAPGDDDDGEAAVGRGNGANHADVSAPTNGHKANGARKLAPKANEETEVWRRLANEIKAAIDEAPTLKALNDEMQIRGETWGEEGPREGSDLFAVRKASEEAYRFLADRANKRRPMLAQAPSQAA